MVVKRSRSGSRTLSVLEAVAAGQPIGVSQLARRLAIDKSAAQRSLMTLADDDWIRPAPGTTMQWELAPRILSLARAPSSVEDLRRRARPVLERLRDDSGETVFLTVPDARRFMVVDALESGHVLRIIPTVGMIVPLRESATGRAVLAYCDEARRDELLGEAPDAALLDALAAARRLGYAISDGDIDPTSVSFAAPVFAAAGDPAGAVVVAGPRERIAADRHATIGALLVGAVARLSTGRPAPVVPQPGTLADAAVAR